MELLPALTVWKKFFYPFISSAVLEENVEVLS